MTKYIGYKPLNAEVIVDYTKPKSDRIKFSYPNNMSYNEALWKMVYSLFLFLWLFWHLCILIVTIILWTFYEIIIFMLSPLPVESLNIDWILLLKGIIIVIFGLIYIFVIPYLIMLIASRNKERFSVWFPKMNYLFGLCTGNQLICKRFEKKDIKENQIIIPEFLNVYLNFKADGDFNKYLTRIQILSAPFEYKTYSLIQRKILNEKIKDTYFQAVFTFSKKVNNGYLEVEYI